jgi:hypothetical protein
LNLTAADPVEEVIHRIGRGSHPPHTSVLTGTVADSVAAGFCFDSKSLTTSSCVNVAPGAAAVLLAVGFRGLLRRYAEPLIRSQRRALLRAEIIAIATTERYTAVNDSEIRAALVAAVSDSRPSSGLGGGPTHCGYTCVSPEKLSRLIAAY